MPTPKELEKGFWKALESDRTIMLGLDSVEDGHVRPMTGIAESSRSPIWFFTTNDSMLVTKLVPGSRAIATFVSKGHDLFAAIHGGLSVSNDRAVIDRLWNPYVAAWYKGGKDDPSLTLLRLDAERAEIWENGSSIVAGIKMMFGIDPKQDYKNRVAEVSLK